MGFRWKRMRERVRAARRWNFYRRSLILVLCITSLPTAVIGITSYVTGRNHIEQEVARSHEALLHKTLERMSDNLAQLELAATQWSLDSRLDARLKTLDLKDQYTTTQGLYQFLGLMKSAYPLINRVEIYVDQEHPVMISDIDGLIPVIREQDAAELRGLFDSNRGVFWHDSFRRMNGRGTEPELALIHKLPSIGQPYGALILYLDKPRLVQMVEEMTTDADGASFLMNQQGQFLDPRPGVSDSRQALELAMRDGVLKSGKKNGSFLLSFKGQNFNVSFGEFSRPTAPWKYATATSLTQLTAPVILMSRMMLAIGLLGLTMAVLLSWIASRSLYRPIGRLFAMVKSGKDESGDGLSDEISFIESQWKHLTEESRELEARLEQAYPSLRSAFLMQLVQGHFYSLSEEEIRKRMNNFGWEAEREWFGLILLQINGMSREDGRFQESDAPLVTFAVSNIAEEIIRTRSSYAESINFQDLTVGILLSYPQDRSRQQVKEELHGLADDLVKTISSLLKLQTTICIGNVTAQVSELPRLLPYLRNAIKYRDLQENCQVLDLDELVPGVHGGDMGYPFELEKELTQVLRMGQTEQAMSLIRTFIQELTRQTGNEKLLREGGMQVLGTILHTMLETGFHPHQVFGGQNLYEELYHLREPEQLTRFFQYKVIRPYVERLNEHQNLHLKQLVEHVTDHMKQRFTSDISLEECSDLFGVSPYALSRAFKQVHGMNYIDYLIRLRIDKAKELLTGTNLKIHDIAEQVGYQPSYFIRLFKKMEDMTPGQYRERASG